MAALAVAVGRPGGGVKRLHDSRGGPGTLPPPEPGFRRVYLLRHGETDWNARGMLQGGGFDIDLNATGRHQACLQSYISNFNQ